MSNRHALGTVLLVLATAAACSSTSSPGGKDAGAMGGTGGGSGSGGTGSGGAVTADANPGAGGGTGSGGAGALDVPMPFEAGRDTPVPGSGGAVGLGGVFAAEVNGKTDLAGGTGGNVSTGGKLGTGGNSRSDGAAGGALGSGGTVGADGSASVCLGSYDACICGCCTDPPRDTMCYYPTAGETLDPIKAHDGQVRSSTNCATAGCASGIRYVCCLPAEPEPASSATYSASAWMGDVDHLTIDKVGKECVSASFDSGSARTGYHVDAPAGWAFTAGAFGPCIDGGIGASVRGALGSFAMRRDGNTCVADVHLTLYSFGTGGEIKTVRMDADGVPIGGASGGGFCP